MKQQRLHTRDVYFPNCMWIPSAVRSRSQKLGMGKGEWHDKQTWRSSSVDHAMQHAAIGPERPGIDDNAISL